MLSSTTELLAMSPNVELYPLQQAQNIERRALKGLGRPQRKRYLTVGDYLGSAITAACFVFALIAVWSVPFAVYLGQVSQLVVLGLALSIMAATTTTQAQLFLITLEARYGSSTLQNYDAILRNTTLTGYTSSYLKLILVVLYVLPLGLSASYKQFVGGKTTISVPATQPIQFGPSGPPGLYLGNGITGYINATSSLHDGQPQGRSQPPAFPSSFGFNMHIINSTVSVMLDTPLSSELSGIQASLQRGETKTLAATVDATFSSLNSTPSSSERTGTYWVDIRNRFGQEQPFYVSWGSGTYFSMWNADMDQSLVFLSYFNQTKNETFESEANGFNIYRGSRKGSWLVSASGVFLEDASNLETTWSPSTPLPSILGPNNCSYPTGIDARQTVVTCFWNPLAFNYYTAVGQYIVPILNSWKGTHDSQLSMWVATVAAVWWSSMATNLVPAGPTFDSAIAHPDFLSKFPYLVYNNRSYELTSTFPTLKRHWGLLAVLAVQPVLLAFLITGRLLLYSTPVSQDFGIVALLAGAQRSSLDVLGGAAFSGQLEQSIKVQIMVPNADTAGLGEHTRDSSLNSVQYIFVGAGETARLSGHPRRRTNYRRPDARLRGEYENLV